MGFQMYMSVFNVSRYEGEPVFSSKSTTLSIMLDMYNISGSSARTLDGL